MTQDIIKRFYQRKANEIQNKYEAIIELIEHPGEKGNENENILINFLRDFLPKKYSIGTGFLIDSDGNTSSQCDLIIYDNLFNPNLMKFDNNQYFPIESVYGIIEVKTCLRANDLEKSFRDFDKIKNMKFISEPVQMIRGNTTTLTKTTKPFYILFAYNSEWNNSQLLLDNLERKMKTDFFDRLVIFNVGIIKEKSRNENLIELEFFVFPVLNEQNDMAFLSNSNSDEKTIIYNGNKYPIFGYKNDTQIIKYLIDINRCFLSFVYDINQFVSYKELGINYLRYYFPIWEKTLFIKSEKRIN